MKVVSGQVLLVINNIRGPIPRTHHYDIITTCALCVSRQERKGNSLTTGPPEAHAIKMGYRIQITLAIEGKLEGITVEQLSVTL